MLTAHPNARADTLCHSRRPGCQRRGAVRLPVGAPVDTVRPSVGSWPAVTGWPKGRAGMKLPIVYVRGFAGSTSGINEAVDDPFYGFNLGATHVRVGGDGEPHFYQFESPMLRLLVDRDEDGEAYQILVHGGQEAYLNSQDAGKVGKNTIWIHRFYDESASTFGKDPQKYQIENAAADLLRLVDLVLLKTGAEKVHLVAHSMGGLVQPAAAGGRARGPAADLAPCPATAAHLPAREGRFLRLRRPPRADRRLRGHAHRRHRARRRHGQPEGLGDLELAASRSDPRLRPDRHTTDPGHRGRSR